MTIKWPIKHLIAIYVSALIVLSAISSCIGIYNPLAVLNENQVLYMFSTSAQVISAIYGLTLTGFLFFRNELSREATEDETLKEAIDQLKRRYYALLIFITLLVGLTLLLSNAVIAYETDPRRDITTILANVAQSALAVSFVAITVFVFDVIAPGRIEKASQSLKDELDPDAGDKPRGNLEEFLRNFNRIEALLVDAGAIFQVSSSSVSLDGRPYRRMSNARLADLLARSGRIRKELYGQLRELITLRNAIIHGAEPVVSQDIVEVSGELRLALEIALAQDAVPDGQE